LIGFYYFMNPISELRATRRYLTSFLLNVDLDTRECTIGTLLTMLDHFAEHPDDYLEMTNGTKSK
jgi:hypothetical protein